MVRMLGYWTSFQPFSADAFGNTGISVVLYWHEKQKSASVFLSSYVFPFMMLGERTGCCQKLVLVWVRLYFPRLPLGCMQ